MIDVKNLILKLEKNKINFFCGVPDSILKPFTNYIEQHKKNKHLICANEGGAIGIGVGNYLSSKKITCVYMQNSGLGNAVNPLVSIAHKKIYSVPMVLLIGWRGAPGISDEAQHQKQGLITKELLKLMDIKCLELKSKTDLYKVSKIIRYARNKKTPVALIVKKNVLFYESKQKKVPFVGVDRSYVINQILGQTNKTYKIISTTGYISRDLFRLSRKKYKYRKNFYMIGGMGHAQMVAYGVANFSKKKIVCLDGDGSLIMHLGSSSLLANYKKNNLKYILLNNGVHESVGAQYCISQKINFKKLSESLGFKNYLKIRKKKEVKYILKKFFNKKSNSFLEVIINKSNLDNLPRIKNTENILKTFMKN